MKQTIMRARVVHIISHINAGGRTGSTMCGRAVQSPDSGTQLKTKNASEQVPTCKACLTRLFDNLQTNYSLEKKVKLYKDNTHKIMNALGTLIRVQKGVTEDGARDSENEAYKEGSYPFIPNSTDRIFHEFILLKEFLKKEKRWSGHDTVPTKFVDAGCGIGNIMLLAKSTELCHRVDGIEYFPKTADAAKRWLGTNRNDNYFNIIVADIMKYRKYREYDIVYFYCPFADHRLQVLFEERLENQMKVGAVLIPHLKKGQAIRDDDRFERLTFGQKNDYGYGPFAFIKVKGGRRKVSEAKQVMKQRYHSRNEKAVKEKYKL